MRDSLPCGYPVVCAIKAERDALRARVVELEAHVERKNLRIEAEMQRGDKLDAALIDLHLDLGSERAAKERAAKEIDRLNGIVAKLEAALRALRQHWCNHYCAIGLHTGICDNARKALEG